jgi:hypothetical protein
LVLLCGSLLPPGAGAAPKARLWERWSASDEQSGQTVDHGSWQRFLDRYVRAGGSAGITRVGYNRVSRQDRDALADYLRDLQGVAVSRLNRAEQMAYWINLYNALTVKVVLDSYPVASITRINLGLGLPGRGPWEAKLLEIEGEAVSLNDIEHRILRPIWKDPRVHYAVNCASLGCPNLQERAYSAANLEGLLQKAAREYVGHPRGARFQDGVLYLSSLYSWFREDFGGSVAGVLEHLARYSEEPAVSRLRGFRGPLKYEYDWSLNE